MSEEEKNKADSEGSKNEIAKITLTKEVTERIDEMVAKMEEKYAEKSKAFRFHGTESSEKESEAAKAQKDAAVFIKAVAQEDVATAMKFHANRSKTINGTTNANGGFLVPTVFETEIEATFDTYSEIIADADVQSYNRPGKIFNLNELDTRVVVYNTNENSTGVTGSTPTFTEPQIAVDDWLGATDMTQDFLEDTEANITSNLSAQFGEELAKSFQNRLINGNVTVSGVVTKGLMVVAGANDVEIATTTTGYTGVSASDVEKAYFDAIAVDHFQTANKNGKWYMHPLAMQALRASIRGASSDRDYLSVFDPVNNTIMGRPVVMTNQMPIPTTTTSNPFMLYADLRNHLKIRRKRGMTMKINDSGTSLNGRNLNYQLGRELVVSQRIGHQVILQDGLTRLVT